MSANNLRAALQLNERGDCRGAVNRAYYAAYCSIAGELLIHAPHLTFPYSRKNPPHRAMGDYIRAHFPVAKYGARRKSVMVREIMNLRDLREMADYRPDAVLDSADARTAIRTARQIMFAVGVVR